MEIVIVGAGVIGATCAFRLAQAGHGVTVIDRDGIATQASGRSFGWVNASFFLSPEHFALRREGIAAHHRLEAEIGAYANWCGALVWDVTGDEAEAMAADLSAEGYAVERLTASQAAAREPALANPPEGALFFAGEGAADPGDLARAALAAACGLGARAVTGLAVDGLQVDDGRVRGVRTAAGPIAADMVLLAAGTATPGLLEPLSVALPMPPRPGLMLRTAPTDRLINHVLVAPEGEIRQAADGTILHPVVAGHQADDASAVADPLGVAAQAHARLQRLFPGFTADWREVTVGWRPVPSDGLPAIGAVAPGAYVATMHSGATLAPIVAELVTQEIGGSKSAALATSRPDRFA